MKRLFIFICLCFAASVCVFAQQNNRKKVGVVLSGGGAKGAAHAKALKVIEEAGIPIDYIAGTSIGSLVGGMYASGYNADQIDSIMRSQNWKSLLMDMNERKSVRLTDRQRTDKYMLAVKFDKSPFEIIEGGVLKGYNVAKLLTEITADTPDSIDFNTLKIPFACVATNVVTGEEIDMRSGVLAESMRASMAIPTVFAPVVKGNMVLTDGGTSNNYPVDLARKMGADYVIGVDLADGTLASNKLNTTQAIATQLIDLLCLKKHDENVANTDVYIKVNVNGYSAASFNNEAIDTLMARGEVAARAKWDELIALRNKLGLQHPQEAQKARPMPEHMYDVVPVPSIYKNGNRNSFVGVGAKFNNEELASLLVGGKYELNHKNKLCVGIEARLGRMINTELYSAVNLNKAWQAQFTYNFQYNDFKIYDMGSRASNEVYRGHVLQLDFSRNWNNFKALIGTSFSYYNFDESLVNKDHFEWTEDVGDEKGLSYFARITYDNRDTYYNAKRGMIWTAGYQFFTDDFSAFEGGKGMNILDASFSIALPLSSKTILTPSVATRCLSSRNDYFTLDNCIGGVNANGHYLPQQIAFAGVNYMQLTKSYLFVAGFSLRQYLTTNNYLFAVGNYGMHSDKFFNVSTPSRISGAALGYGYNTPVGPVEFNMNWSNVTKKLGYFISFGYMF